MICYFGPLVPKILKITDKLTVFEKREINAAKIRTLPSERARDVLPYSDVIILSASTLANRTFDELLSLRGGAREIILLGPSAPLYPKPFFERGVTAVMGTRILDPLSKLKNCQNDLNYKSIPLYYSMGRNVKLTYSYYG
jgi:uncharacterized protein